MWSWSSSYNFESEPVLHVSSMFPTRHIRNLSHKKSKALLNVIDHHVGTRKPRLHTKAEVLAK